MENFGYVFSKELEGLFIYRHLLKQVYEQIRADEPGAAGMQPPAPA